MKITRRFMWPYVVSVGLHTSLVAGLLYASISRIYPSTPVEQPMSVTLVAPAPEPAAAPAPPPQPVAPAEPQPVPEPQPISEPQPVAEPPAPVNLPKPKPKPKPAPKKEVKPRLRKEPAQVAPTPTDAPSRETPLPAAAPATAPAASSATAAESGPVALSRPEPSYPERARALGIEGRVQIQFDVNSNGQVENLRVISATPPNMFERDIREVTRRWRYQSGKPGNNISLTVVFKLSGVKSGE